MSPDPLQDGNLDPIQKDFDNLSKKPNKFDGDKRSKGGIIALVVIILLVGAAIAVLALDIGNVRSVHIGEYLRNAPLIGRWFPQPEEDPFEGMTEDEMRIELVRLQTLADSFQTQRDQFYGQLVSANEHIEHLSELHRRWNEFRDVYASFTQSLAHEEPLNFQYYFNTLLDENRIPREMDIFLQATREASEINAYDEELRMLVSTYSTMEAGRAAEDLARLLQINPTLAVRIARAMSTSTRAEIFEEMEYTVSATFSILLSTEPPTFAQLVPLPNIPYIPDFTPSAAVPAAPAPTEEPAEQDDAENAEEPEYDEEPPTEDEEESTEEDETETDIEETE